MKYILLDEKPENDGWSDYVAPPDNNIRVECCGCGLVHDIEIRPDATPMPRVVIRFKRNMAATRRRRKAR
jgi:hypothetical protein